MKTTTEELRAYLPRLYATREEPDPVAVLRFVETGVAATSWYAVEFDGKDTLYGLVVRHGETSTRLEYFSLRELVDRNGSGGTNGNGDRSARQDHHYVPRPISRILPTPSD